MAKFVLSHNLRVFVNTTFLLLLLCVFFTTHIRSPSTSFNFITTDLKPPKSINDSTCIALEKPKDPQSKYLHLKTHTPCITQGYINYLNLFYCICGTCPFLGHTLLTLWLLLLFYLLANTSSQYFCPSVESLSSELRLSPAIAGVALLSFRNGTPDVLSSVVSSRSGSGEVGLSSVLGSAFFVSCVVVGVINVCTSSRLGACNVDRAGFGRDACFFLHALSCLLVVLVIGKINIWGAIAFTSLYFVYILVVSVVHCCRCSDKYDDFVVPILDKDNIESVSIPKEALPHDQGNEDEDQSIYYIKLKATASYYIGWFFDLIGVPLYLPRWVTIADVSEDRWCRPFAVASATFAPLLVATLWNSKRGRNGIITREALTIFLCATLLGLLLGAVALKTTKESWPPKKGLFPWLAGGFLMSVLWTYIIAKELVGLPFSLGCVFGFNPSVLGLTVPALGNSIGDLIANVAMAVSGGLDGVQIAISGCCAGPIFNTLAGLGSSLVVSAWSAHPMPFVIPVGPALFEILGFMMGGLVWALVMFPKRDMKLDRVLGIGLLAIYSCFLSLRLSQSLGLVQL